MSFKVKNIAIIGAGPAGLASARYLREQKAFDRIVIYEQQSEVGGVWNYSNLTPKTTTIPQTNPLAPPDPPRRPLQDIKDGATAGSNPNGAGTTVPPVFPTPMYQDLNTNIPHTLMNYSDLPFPAGCTIFPPRQEVQSYLVAYSTPVRRLIRFHTRVTNIRLDRDDTGSDKWHVESSDTVSGNSSSEVFDALVVASGHYALPYVPNIPGISEFNTRYPGVVSHAKIYRGPAPFAGKKTIVVGNAASGLDIARQINVVCKRPLLMSVQSPTPEPQLFHAGPEEVPEIEAFLVPGGDYDGEGPAVRFKGGRTEDVDAVLFCTGYLFSYPFLENNMLGDPPLVDSGRRVQGLYRHIFHIRHPTVVFPGLLIRAVPFPVCEGQAAVFARVWSNALQLPLVEEMVEWEKAELRERGEAIHVMPKGGVGGDIDYINSVHDWAMSAAEGSGGKVPPRWEGEVVWERRNYQAAKLAFEKDGKRAQSLAEIGFVYPGPTEGED